MSEPIPSDRSRFAKAALALLAGALGTALIGGAIWLVLDSRKPQPPRQTEIEPAEKTGEPTSTTQSAEPTVPGTGSLTPTQSAPGNAGGPDTSGAAAAQPRVAYRMGGRIWVAREDGSKPVDVAPAASTYAVSPDGSLLAVINDPPRNNGRVLVYQVKTSGSLRIGGMGAYPGWLSWSPDGRYIAYSSGTLESSSIREMLSDGANDAAVVASGGLARFSPDGMSLAYRPSGSPGTGAQLRVLTFTSSAYPQGVGSASAALSFAFAPDGALYFSRPGSGTAWEILRARAPYTWSEKVGTIKIAAPAYALCDLAVSPNGRYVLTGARGDDHYCRLWVLDTSTGKAWPIPTRRDATPYGWTSDGRILYFEGNTYQGESSSLMSSRTDGTYRRVVVAGAAQ